MTMRLIRLCVGAFALNVCSAYSAFSKKPQTRRDVFDSSIKTFAFVAAGSTVLGQPSFAFQGGGSSAYSGRTPATKAALVKGYKARIAADVYDFNALGNAVDRGEVDGNEWVSFFIPYQRREADEVGRTYAAMIDLVGLGKDKSGGAGMLLASTFAKPNKPPDNLPQVKAFNAFAKTLDPIEKAGKAGDAPKAQKAWAKASVAFSEYLQQVEMPPSLSDPLYQK